jgi:hypothetical protein
MRSQVEFSCEQHASAFDCPDALVSYTPKFNEYALIVHDGGSSGIRIAFCPWCGAKLPESLREKWFAELEALGFEDPGDEAIPSKYKSEEWYRDV